MEQASDSKTSSQRKEKQAAKRLELKQIVINHYGSKCECCGIDDIWLLSIDHIDGGGNQHRKSLGIPAGANFYKWLQKNDFPSGFRVLCHNCNCALGHHGYCPHQGEVDRNVKTSSFDHVSWGHNSKLGYCRICDVLLDESNWYKHHKSGGKNICKRCHQRNESSRIFAMKKELFANYGGKCVECGEAHLEFLTIDHIYDDGGIEREKTGRFGYRFYKWLIAIGCPQDRYQILCHNCNSKKEYLTRRSSNRAA